VKERLSKGTFLGFATLPLFTFVKGFSSFDFKGKESFLSFLSSFSFFLGFEGKERGLFGDGREVEGRLEEVIMDFSWLDFFFFSSFGGGGGGFIPEWLDSKRIPTRPLALQWTKGHTK